MSTELKYKVMDEVRMEIRKGCTKMAGKWATSLDHGGTTHETSPAYRELVQGMTDKLDRTADSVRHRLKGTAGRCPRARRASSRRVGVDFWALQREHAAET